MTSQPISPDIIGDFVGDLVRQAKARTHRLDHGTAPTRALPAGSTRRRKRLKLRDIIGYVFDPCSSAGVGW